MPKFSNHLFFRTLKPQVMIHIRTSQFVLSFLFFFCSFYVSVSCHFNWSCSQLADRILTLILYVVLSLCERVTCVRCSHAVLSPVSVLYCMFENPGAQAPCYFFLSQFHVLSFYVQSFFFSCIFLFKFIYIYMLCFRSFST